MIEVLEISKDIIGFKLSREVSAKEYEDILMPALKSKAKEQKKLKVLYQIGKDFDRYDFSAMLDDAKVGFVFYLLWEKIAVVSNIEWINDVVKAFSFVVPAKIRVFENRDIEKAKEWLKE